MLSKVISVMKIKNKTNLLNYLIILLAIIGLLGLRAANSSCPELLNHEFPKLQDDTPQNLCMYENSVVLVVNTASFCGFTKQYEGLQNLWDQYKNEGLIVLGVPSNSFNQENKTDNEVKDFCEVNFDINFPLTTITEVRGNNAHEIYKWALQNYGKSAVPKWNFHKILIDKEGKIHKTFNSFTKPTSNKIILEIENLLKIKS